MHEIQWVLWWCWVTRGRALEYIQARDNSSNESSQLNEFAFSLLGQVVAERGVQTQGAGIPLEATTLCILDIALLGLYQRLVTVSRISVRL